MYLVGDSSRVSFKWVVIISTKQETAHTQSAKVSTCYTLWHFGDWSLIMGRGGYKTALGGRSKWSFTPSKRGGGRKNFSRVEGGHKKFWGSFSMGAWTFSHSEWRGGGGSQSFHPLKEQSRPFASKVKSADVGLTTALAWPRFCDVIG